MKKIGLYIHIPFCEKKCSYCGFLSFQDCDRAKKTSYVEALCNEIDLKLKALADYAKTEEGKRSTSDLSYCSCEEIPKQINHGYLVDTVFIGGGTPSCLEALEIVKILNRIRQCCIDGENLVLAEDVEITIEANPGTLTEEKLIAYKEAGINRLSMGVQSFNDKVLEKIGRIHRGEEVIENFNLARETGFDNINLDLMFSLPYQNMGIWLDTLEQAVKLNPEHISFYRLQLEENTELFNEYRNGKLELPSDEVDRDMYHRAIKLLKKSGFEHYEISNAAKISKENKRGNNKTAFEVKNGLPHGYYCKHNLKYWEMEEFLGFGLGAGSFMGYSRFTNTQDVDTYLKLFGMNFAPKSEEKGKYEKLLSVDLQAINPLNNLTYAEEEQKLRKALALGTYLWHDEKLHDLAGEFVFTGLRKLSGISLEEFETYTGQDFMTYYEPQIPFMKLCESQGQLIFDENTGNLRLTEKGIDVSNAIMAEFV